MFRTASASSEYQAEVGIKTKNANTRENKESLQIKISEVYLKEKICIVKELKGTK